MKEEGEEGDVDHAKDFLYTLDPNILVFIQASSA